MEGMGTAESSDVRLSDIAIHISNNSPAACQGAMMVERSRKKAIWGEVWSPIDSRWQHC